MEGEIRGEATEQFAVKEGAEIRGTVRTGQKSCSVWETTRTALVHCGFAAR